MPGSRRSVSTRSARSTTLQPLFGGAGLVHFEAGGEQLQLDHAAQFFFVFDNQDSLARANLEGPETITIKQVAEAVRDLVGRNMTIEEMPGRPGDYRDRIISAAKAFRDLGWEPEVPFSEGMRRTFAWFVAQQRATEHLAVAAGT